MGTTTAARRRRWAPLPLSRSFLAVVTGVDQLADLASELAALRAVMHRANPQLVVSSHHHPTLRCAVVIVTDDDHPPVAQHDRVVWGVPAGAGGLATDDELDRLLAEPRSGRDLAGVWVAVGPHGDGLRAVTSPHVIHSLKHVAWGGREVLATRSSVALILAGRRPVVRSDVIPELVALDFVMGDDDLFDGVTVLPEATVVDVTSSRVTRHRYLSLEERVAARRPRANPARLVDALGEGLERWAQLEDVELGLTAGVDSSLIASVAGGRGLHLRCFTMGPAGLPDVTAAACTAEQLGFTHHRLDLTSPDGYAELVARTPLSDGQEAARNVVGGAPVLPQTATWLGGWGGEIGRAFYWADQTGPFRADEVMAWLASDLPSPARRVLSERLAAELAGLRAIADDEALVLDLFYLADRLRKWLGRLPPWDTNGLIGAYLDPTVTAALLSGTPDERRRGAAFGLAERAAPAASPATSSQTRSRARALAGSAFRRARTAISTPARVEAHDWPPLAALLENAGDAVDPVEAVLGSARWQQLLHDGRDPLRPQARRALWNALSIAAAHEWSESLPGTSRPG